MKKILNTGLSDILLYFLTYFVFNRFIFWPLIFSADAKAARLAAGVSNGGHYPCQMCYIHVNQITKFDIASCITLRHWKVTASRLNTRSTTFIPLGDNSYPIWMNPAQEVYLSNEYGTEYLSVLLCVMHVIEGWSNHLFTLIISYFKNKQSTCNLLATSIQGILFKYI